MPKTAPVKERTRTQLQRLKWGMVFASLLLLVPYEVYNLLVVKTRWQEALLDAFVVLVASLMLVQVSFSIIFRLYDRSMQQRVRLATLHQVDVELSASLDQKRVLEAVLAGVLRLTPAQGARIFTYDAERREFAAGWERLASGEYCSIDYRPRPDGFNARVVRTGELLVIEDTVARSSVLSAEDLARGIRAAAGIPLLRGDQVLGVLSIGFGGPHTFTEDELETLRLLGNRAAVALDNARQYQRAEAAEARFRDVALSSADWVWEVDVQGRYTYCSENVVDVLGYTPEEVLGKTPFEFMPPDEAVRVGEIFAEIAADRQLIVDLENRNLTKDGDEIVLLTNGVLILDSEGYLLGYRGMDKDITERKRVEEALQESEERYRSLFEDAPIPLWEEDFSEAKAYLDSLRTSGVKDLRAYFEDHPEAFAHCGMLVKMVDVNKATLKMYKARSKEEFLKGLATVFSEESWGVYREELIATVEGKTRFESEVIHRTLTGERRHVTLTWQVAPGYEETASKVLISIIDITERKRAEEALQRRNRELAALNAVGDVITSTLDLRTMLNLTIDKAVGLLQTEAGSLWLVDQGTGELVCEITADPDSADLVGTRLPPGTGVVGAVVQEGKPIIVGEAQTDRRWYRGFDDQTAFTTRSIIAVPMVSRGRTIGAIELLNRRDGVAFTDDDERLLTAIGQQIGVAVENARLFEETRARGHQTELLLSASEAAASTLDSVEVLRRVARAVARTIGADMTGAYLLDESGTALRPIIGYHVPPERLEAYLQFQIPLKGHPFVEEAWQSKQAVFTNEAGNDSRFDAQTRQLLPATSVLLIPMIVKGEIIGALLAVWWEEAHRFTEEELRLGEGIVRQAAVAIQNARLFEEARRRAGQLEALSEIGRAIGSTLDLDAVLRLILERLGWVAPYDTVSLWLREEEVMRIRATMGFEDSGAVVGLAVPIQEDRLFQELVHTRQPLVIADAQQDERFRGFAGTEWVRSWLGVPLLSKGEVVGLLTIDKGESGSYTAEMGELTLAFGQQAAMAIENARLFTETRRRVRELRLLHDVGLAAASGVRPEEMLQAAVEALAAEFEGIRAGGSDCWSQKAACRVWRPSSATPPTWPRTCAFDWARGSPAGWHSTASLCWYLTCGWTPATSRQPPTSAPNYASL